jgi:deoxyribonuclease V
LVLSLTNSLTATRTQVVNLFRAQLAALGMATKIDRALIRFFIGIQKKLATNISFDGWNGELRRVLGLDVAYVRDTGIAAAVLYDRDKESVLTSNTYKAQVFFPYIPGLLYLREAPLMIAAAEPLKDDFDLALVDGHGYAHPRRAGLAVIVGVILDRPVIGVAKSLLEGKVHETAGISPILANGEVIGWASGGQPRYYASVGNKVSNEDVKRILSKLGNDYPAPLKEAHRLANKIANEIKI